VPLENRFAVPDPLPGRVDGIVLLGGAENVGQTRLRGIVAVNGAADRLIAFADLTRRYPTARLAYSGGSGSLSPEAMREAGQATAREMLASLDARLNGGIPPQGLSWTVRAPDNAEGRFTVSVATANGPALNVQVVLGDRYPPAAAEANDHDGPVRSLRVVYPQPAQKRVLFTPFAFAGWNWDTGWLILYVVVYLAVFLPAKALLRVP